MMIKGTVENVHGDPNPNSFVIKGEDGKEYFAHIGDIQANEDLLYNDQQTIRLKVGDKVEFKSVEFDSNRVRAINVEKK